MRIPNIRIMKPSDGVEWVSAAASSWPCSRPVRRSRRAAEFHGVPDAYLAKHLQALGRAGVLRAGSAAARSPQKAELLRALGVVVFLLIAHALHG